MTQVPRMKLSGVVLDAPEPRALAAFYSELLGWPIRDDEETWVTLDPPVGSTPLSFQYEPVYARPTWPSTSDAQQMSLHLDIEVDDLDTAGVYATAAGATLAEYQPQDDVRVYLDPAGHPFCLWVRE